MTCGCGWENETSLTTPLIIHLVGSSDSASTCCLANKMNNALVSSHDHLMHAQLTIPAPETLPVPDQPDVSPLPPIAAVYHNIPNPKCPSMNIAKEILGQRQASTYYARHIECSSIIMDALTVPLMPLLPHVETPEMAALFERIDIARWKLSMLVLNVGHYCGISVSGGTSANR